MRFVCCCSSSSNNNSNSLEKLQIKKENKREWCEASRVWERGEKISRRYEMSKTWLSVQTSLLLLLLPLSFRFTLLFGLTCSLLECLHYFSAFIWTESKNATSFDGCLCHTHTERERNGSERWGISIDRWEWISIQNAIEQHTTTGIVSHLSIATCASFDAFKQLIFTPFTHTHTHKKPHCYVRCDGNVMNDAVHNVLHSFVLSSLPSFISIHFILFVQHIFRRSLLPLLLLKLESKKRSSNRLFFFLFICLSVNFISMIHFIGFIFLSVSRISS